jgi:hypothetical protein
MRLSCTILEVITLMFLPSCRLFLQTNANYTYGNTNHGCKGLDTPEPVWSQLNCTDWHTWRGCNWRRSARYHACHSEHVTRRSARQRETFTCLGLKQEVTLKHLATQDSRQPYLEAVNKTLFVSNVESFHLSSTGCTTAKLPPSALQHMKSPQYHTTNKQAELIKYYRIWRSHSGI